MTPEKPLGADSIVKHFLDTVKEKLEHENLTTHKSIVSSGRHTHMKMSVEMNMAKPMEVQEMLPQSYRL